MTAPVGEFADPVRVLIQDPWLTLLADVREQDRRWVARSERLRQRPGRRTCTPNPERDPYG